MVNMVQMLKIKSEKCLNIAQLASSRSDSDVFNVLPLPSEEQSRLAARKYARVVQKLGFPARFLDFTVQNMVASCDVRFPISLEGLVLTHQQFSRYDCITSL